MAFWAQTHNTERTHSAIGYQTSAVFAAYSAQWAIIFAQPKRSADRPLTRRRNCAKLDEGHWSEPDELWGAQQNPRMTPPSDLRHLKPCAGASPSAGWNGKRLTSRFSQSIVPPNSKSLRECLLK
jgi:hypothetical protein